MNAARPIVLSLVGTKPTTRINPWEVFHLRSLEGRVTTPWINQVWVPLIGCAECREEFQRLRVAIPFRILDQFACGVDWHNAVNSKLDKPQLTLEQAHDRWCAKASEAVAA